MADERELAFVKTFTTVLSSQPVTYEDDFQPPLENYLRKVPVLPVPVPAPPERKVEEEGPADAITITIKSTKPHQTYSLSVQPTDTISDIKSQLAAVSGAPPADVQRLLVKGKVFSDGKLLKEYDVKDGDTITLMIKPGYHWDPTAVSSKEQPSLSTSSPANITPEPSPPPPITLVPEPKESRSKHGHGRIPSVVLSPSPSLTPLADEKLVDIPLILDTSNIPPSADHAPDTPYHNVISQPDFWERLYTFLSNQFPTESDAAAAWEDFFCASKGVLSVSEIAKIRDKVGVIGMAGT